jgi:hypothetical protein
MDTALAASDVVLIPSDYRNPVKQAKSPNRLVASLHGGRCVVAHPLPPYAPCGEFAWLGEDLCRELAAYVLLMKSGDYLVVEDSCVNGHPVRPDFGPGPMEALEDYLQAHPGELMPDTAREEKFACTFAPRGYYRKK